MPTRLQAGRDDGTFGRGISRSYLQGLNSSLFYALCVNKIQ